MTWEDWRALAAASRGARGGDLEQAGLTRLKAQHLFHRDLDAIELLGREVIPALAR